LGFGVWGLGFGVAFGTTGQRCTATSRIYVHESLFEEFKKKLVMRAKKIKIGEGLKSATEMGPIINEKQLKKVDEYVRIGESEGAKVECGGKKATEKGLANGYFYLPTVLTNVDQTKRVVREEIFGPVVCLMSIKNLDEALEKMNDCSYGLSSSVYTRDVNAAMRVIRDAEAGITYINGPTIGAEVHMPFGGVKNTGNGHREAGDHGIDIFSEWKSVYIDYSGKLQKAQIDTE
jgi:acyl-CoA reductase-like NAD-dependent aldehyde dehydrogenase